MLPEDRAGRSQETTETFQPGPQKYVRYWPLEGYCLRFWAICSSLESRKRVLGTWTLREFVNDRDSMV